MTPIGTGRSCFRRLAALICLLAFGLGPTKLIPLAIALTAGAEGSHGVSLEADFAGTKVVLSHAPREGEHHHGVVSRAVCLLTAEQAGQADHVACFPSGGIVESESKAPRHGISTTASRSCSLAQFFAALALPHHRNDASVHLPKGFHAAVACQMQSRIDCLLSTCLLI